MAVDKILEIDLTQLTREGANELTNEFQDIIKQTGQTQQQKLKTTTKGKSSLSRLFGREGLTNLVNLGKNPTGFLGGLLTKGIPGFSAAVAATAIIGAILKKFDELEKRFTDQISTKRKADRDNEEIARVQAGLAQDIFTPSPGIYDPRDAYNTLDEFNKNQRRIETDYTLRNTSGVE